MYTEWLDFYVLPISIKCYSILMEYFFFSPQVVNEKSMQACSDKPLCVVSVLPHILDCNAACRNDYLAILARLGDKYKNKMWG